MSEPMITDEEVAQIVLLAEGMAGMRLLRGVRRLVSTRAALIGALEETIIAFHGKIGTCRDPACEKSCALLAALHGDKP